MPALLPRLFDLDRDSIIHLHFPPAYASEMVWIYAHMKGHPYLTHFHGVPGPSGPAGFLLRAYEPLLLRAVLHGAAAVAVLTEEHRSMVTEQFGVEFDAGCSNTERRRRDISLRRPAVLAR